MYIHDEDFNLILFSGDSFNKEHDLQVLKKLLDGNYCLEFGRTVVAKGKYYQENQWKYEEKSGLTEYADTREKLGVMREAEKLETKY